MTGDCKGGIFCHVFIRRFEAAVLLLTNRKNHNIITKDNYL